MWIYVGFTQPFNHTVVAYFRGRLIAKPEVQRLKWAFRTFMQGFRTFFLGSRQFGPPSHPPAAQNKVNGGGMGGDLGVTQAGRPPLSLLVIYSLRVVPLAATLPRTSLVNFLG